MGKDSDDEFNQAKLTKDAKRVLHDEVIFFPTYFFLLTCPFSYPKMSRLSSMTTLM